MSVPSARAESTPASVDGNTGGVADALTSLTENFVTQGVIPPPFPNCGEGTGEDYNDVGCSAPPAGCP